ncbi:ribose ABC transporter [Rhizobium sp. TRM96647]|uniref:RbsD/FucU family protein n=1 Tax=unclassified Rhizobium TaxID=2613769 RepID=UPI0021E8BA62|nr:MULTISPECIES: RbsD/FucU domain-containing protein [unclassified Rhizobium]MCV3735097.1 ribose ABC transporter [Rhizobium sp. TRM96647]MCV3757467.1 ribose ABC transporter [Rhizobium sp. TRM96650]
MLKGIHPLLGPDLLHALQSMGHGDDIAIVDANFPAHSMGPKVIRADGVDALAMTEAVLAHMPLDTFVPDVAWRMQVVGDPDAVPPVCVEFQNIVNRLAGDFTVRSVERFAFYEMTRKAAYIIATTEFRLYGNIILKKGVLHPHEVYTV